MSRRSIRFRLTAWYTAILAATFAAGGIGVWLAIRGSINDTVDKELRSRLRAMRDFAQQQSTSSDSPLHEFMNNAARAPGGSRFRVADENGAWIYQSPGTQEWGTAAIDAAQLPRRGRFDTVSENGRPVRVLSAGLASTVVQIGIPLDEFAEMLHAFTWTALLGSPLLLVLASVGGYLMSRRALAPVERIAHTAAEIEAQNLSERLPLLGTNDELDHLSSTLNAMFGRLEQSFRRITQFTADASHELRTPVAIIRITAEVTRKKPRTDKEYVEALDRILAESERTTELIDDLMLLARTDANIEEMALEPVAFGDVVRTAYAEGRILAEASGITVAVERLNPFTVSGDYRALRRLVLILLDNAIKYSKPGGSVQLFLDAEPRGDGSRAVLEVRDNGIGIGVDDLPHVFERFYRASKDRSRKAGGVGLGLSIAQSIARRHGGEIQIESKSGAGSTARLILPIL